jgi:FAD-dependent oxidoreductase domain-containing protein 1
MPKVDVVIAGGGAVGSATAYFLTGPTAFTGTVAVVEPDPGYRLAASTRSAASIRRQFSSPINIEMSTFGMEFMRACGRGLASVSLKESTYLTLAKPTGAAALRRNVEVQRRCGVEVRLLDSAGLAECYPWINPGDLALGADTPRGEGWFDGHGLLQGLRQAALKHGARYIRDRVDRVLMDGAQTVTGVRLGCGEILQCRWLVNATGTNSRALAASAGIDLPVFARKRNVFVFSCAQPPANCPLIVDPSSLWCRPEGNRFICGVAPLDDPDVAADDFEVDYQEFEELVWPALAHRVPVFDAVRLDSAWAGHYDYNVFDQNAFLGPCESVPNLILASGFSGHGLQHAPAVGRALAEFIRFAEYRSIDATPLSYTRYLRNQPLREHSVI